MLIKIKYTFRTVYANTLYKQFLIKNIHVISERSSSFKKINLFREKDYQKDFTVCKVRFIYI
jgi:hypothetical protein